MPLTKRAVSPVDVSVGRLSSSVQRGELECLANGTLANLVRQLASLSRHAENLIGEIYRDAVKLDHKTNTLAQRVERLTMRVTQLDCNHEPVSLEDLHMRKAFKSSSLVDQHSLDRQTLPTALAEQYAKCDPPPLLDLLNPYRDDKKSALKYYTDPGYFFDLWRQDMLKDVEDSRRARHAKSPTDKSPSRKKKPSARAGETTRMAIAPPTGRYLARHAQDMMQFPAEYQAPQMLENRGSDSLVPPPGMSLPPTSTSPPTSRGNHFNHPMQVSGERGAMDPRSEFERLDLLDPIDDDDLPPPPPPLMHTSLVCQLEAPPEMHFLPSGRAMPPPPPPPPPPSSALPGASAIASFGNVQASAPGDAKRSNFLHEIHAGITLRKVQKQEQLAKEAEENDVAAILRRRMEHVLGTRDSGSSDESPPEDEEWDD